MRREAVVIVVGEGVAAPERGVRLRQLGLVVGAATTLVVAGTAGFEHLRDEGWVAALYRTMTIVTTAGMAEPPTSGREQLLTVALLVTGVAVFLYGIGLLLELVVRGAVGDAWSRTAARRRIDRLSGHHVVCGYGRVGRRIAEELVAAGESVIAVDESDEAAGQAAGDGIPCVQGSAASEATLRAAAVERARTLVACAGDDAVNTFIVLTAREMRPDLHVVARASSDEAAPKLARAGATDVVSPYAMAGRQIARLLTRPHVTAFLTAAIGREDDSFTLEEIEIPADWPRAGVALGELRLRERTGATVLAIRRPGRELETEPPADTRLEPGTILVGAGRPAAIAALERVLGER